MADIQQYSVSIKFKTEGSKKAEDDISKVKDSIGKLKSTSSVSGKVSSAMSKLGSLTSIAGKAMIGLGIAGVAGTVKLSKSMLNLSKQTADYIETVNLFRASMGDLADEAQEFVNMAESKLGLDPKQMMDSISSFQNLSEGFGIASDRAYIMSQNLTQLTGDLSSFANISFEAAQKKLMSGFSGQVMPLRKYGIALDQASLQETAYSLGIQKKIKEMTRAQKTELIYYQIMKSTQKMQGDLGRSLLSPANSLRVIKTEFAKLARTVGSIFIPILMKIIPVVRAVTQVLTQAAEAIAHLLGFEWSNYDANLDSVGNLLNGVSDGVDGIGDSAEDTTKKLNKMLMPFDELNNISMDTGSAGAGAGGDISGGSLGIDLPTYDMFASIDGTMDGIIGNIKSMFETIFEPFQRSWDTYGQGVINSLIYSIQSIGGLVNEVGYSFAEVWTNGTGEKILGTILQIWQEIFKTIGNVSVAFANAWKNDGNGTKIIQELANGLQNILDIVNEAIGVVEEYTARDDFQKFTDSIVTAGETMSSLFEKITAKIKDIWEGGAKETFEKLLEIIGRLGEFINATIQLLKPVVEPFIERTGNLIKDVTRAINNILEVLKGVLDFVVGVFTGDWDRAWKGLYEVAVVNINIMLSNITNLANRIIEIFRNPIESAYNVIKSGIQNISGLFNFQWKLPELKTPRMWWSTQPADGWVADILRAIHLPAELPKFNIEWRAEGGFPETGNLFFANEAGPEMIGKIGNKTAVANQDQITTAIANATYNAISKALSENKATEEKQPIIVNVSDELVYKGYGEYRDAQSRMLGVNVG